MRKGLLFLVLALLVALLVVGCAKRQPEIVGETKTAEIIVATHGGGSFIDENGTRYRTTGSGPKRREPVGRGVRSR